MGIPSVHIEGFNRANGAVGTRETVYGAESSLWRVTPVLETLQDPAGYHHFFNDFYGIDTTNNFTLVADTGGTAAVTDAAGGVLAITTDADDNDEAYVSSKAENWKFAASKPSTLRRVLLARADNLILGLSDTVGADTLLDTEAGPAASYDGAVFFLDAGANWKFETSNAALTMFENASALSAGNIRNIIGDEWRCSWAITDASTDNASFTFSVTAIPM